MKKIRWIYFAVAILSFGGCGILKEEAKILWGSSTQALEEARIESLKASFSCPWETCFDSVVRYANVETQHVLDEKINAEKMNQPVNPADEQTIKVKNFEVFLQDRRRRIIVLMGVPGSVNTTEVGVFFTPLENAATGVEVSSLSTSAKIKVADILFSHLGKEFHVIK